MNTGDGTLNKLALALALLPVHELQRFPQPLHASRSVLPARSPRQHEDNIGEQWLSLTSTGTHSIAVSVGVPLVILSDSVVIALSLSLSLSVPPALFLP